MPTVIYLTVYVFCNLSLKLFWLTQAKFVVYITELRITFSALQRKSSSVRDGENSVQIDDAIVLQTGNGIDQKNAILNLALCCGAIWRRREKSPYMCTTTVHPVCTTAPKIFWKILLPVWLLVRTNLSIPSHFWTINAFDNCCQRYMATYGKKLYRCTSTFSALNCCGGILFKCFS